MSSYAFGFLKRTIAASFCCGALVAGLAAQTPAPPAQGVTPAANTQQTAIPVQYEMPKSHNP